MILILNFPIPSLSMDDDEFPPLPSYSSHTHTPPNFVRLKPSWNTPDAGYGSYLFKIKVMHIVLNFDDPKLKY